MQKFSAFIQSLRRRSTGFTLIELLVVIAIIGILAVAVLATINPLEQINKGRDTRARSDAAQLLSAIERYYTLQGMFPWNGAAIPLATAAYPTTTAINSTTTFDWMTVLTTSSEVKPTFVTRIRNEAKLIVNKAQGSDASIYICFLPTSTAMKLDAARNCASGATPQSLGTGTTFDPCTTTLGTTNIVVAVPPDHVCVP